MVGRRAFWLGLPGRTAQLAAHLRAQGMLNRDLLELLEDALELRRAYWPWDHLFKHIG